MSATTSQTGVRAISESENDDLAAWRAQALERMPYMASTLFALRAVAAPGLGTFAVDAGLRLYVDFDAVRGFGDRWCAEALLHECSHVLAAHASRATNIAVQAGERRAWNYSTDAEINDDLIEAGCSTIAENGIRPAHLGQPDHRTAEEYFDSLRQRAKQSQSSQQSQSGQPFAGCGSGSGGQAAPCELGDDDLGGVAPAASDPEVNWVRVATAAAIREAAKSRGNVPGGMSELADGILAPSKVPWRVLLAAAVRTGLHSRAGKLDATYTRADRRRREVRVGPGRAVFPGSYEPDPSIAVVRDTSGSMSREDLTAVASEIAAISRRVGVRGDRLVVLDVDAKLHAVRAYRNPRSIAEVLGRGGTDMALGIAEAAKLRPRPQVVVVITDGETPWPTHRAGIPVVACLVGAGADKRSAEVPPWFRVVVVDAA